MCVCPACKGIIHEEDNFYIICKGDCAASFHGNCVGMRNIHLNILTMLSRNVLWMCDGCIDAFKHAREDTKQNASQGSSIEAEVKELKGIVTGILDTIAAITANPQMKPTSSLLHSTPISTSMPSDSHTQCDSLLTDDDMKQGKQLTIDSDNFSLLLSNVDVSVSESDIQLMVSRAIGLEYPERIDVTKLVSRWKSRKLDFISFKVVLNSHYKSRALDPATWPENIRFREFIHRNNETWKLE